MPVVTTAIGDLAELFADENIGVLIDEFSPAAYEAAARAVERLAQNAGAREQCRRVAREQLSLQDVGIPRYHRLYRAVASHND